MAWLPNVSLSNFSDLAGAVNNFGDLAGAVSKLSESVKNIEKNFDSALGYTGTQAEEASPTAEAGVTDPNPATLPSAENKGEDAVASSQPSTLTFLSAVENSSQSGKVVEDGSQDAFPQSQKNWVQQVDQSEGDTEEEEGGWAHDSIEIDNGPEIDEVAVAQPADFQPEGNRKALENGQQVNNDTLSSSQVETREVQIPDAPPLEIPVLVADVSDGPVVEAGGDIPANQEIRFEGEANGTDQVVPSLDELVPVPAAETGLKPITEAAETGDPILKQLSDKDKSAEPSPATASNAIPPELAESALDLPGGLPEKVEPAPVEPPQVVPVIEDPEIVKVVQSLPAVEWPRVHLDDSEATSNGKVPDGQDPAQSLPPSDVLHAEAKAAEALAEGQVSGPEGHLADFEGQVSTSEEIAPARVEETLAVPSGSAPELADVGQARSAADDSEKTKAVDPGPGGTEGTELLALEPLQNKNLDSMDPPTVISEKTNSLDQPQSGLVQVQATYVAEVKAQADEMAKLRREYKQMEEAVQAAARQAQSKADELARYMSDNDELRSRLLAAKSQLDQGKDKEKRAADAELDALREEYQHRLSAAERKVYALTKERDMLKREQSRKNDTSALLKEKDEIIKQVMAEGEELSKKQLAQEVQMKKLRSQIRELEEEKQRLTSRLQVEEARVESIKKDKTTTEKALQDAVERGQAELAAQKEFYATALTETKEALAQAEARADSEAKADLDRRVKEAGERERTLVTNVEELRQALSRTEQQAAFREDMLRRDVDDLEKRCQAAEARHEELVARMPDSTRPLLRQIQAMQEAANMRVEALTGVERSLNNRLQEAEAKAAAAEERERACNERLTQTLSRLSVMEAQLALLRAEQSQLARSLEKERARAAENRQEYLVAQEVAATQEGRTRQLEEELREARARSRRELNDERAKREALEQEIENERAAMAEYEKRIRADGRAAAEKAVAAAHGAAGLDQLPARAGLLRVSSTSSGGSAEEGSILAASLSSGPEHFLGSFNLGHGPPSPYGSARAVLSAANLEQMEALLRHKEGELANWNARVAGLESTRDSLAEELVKTTQQCEMLRSEAGSLPGIRAELEALRNRHSSALELMGERDEEVEELRADIMDVKQMYREQIDMLVNQIERLSKEVTVKGT